MPNDNSENWPSPASIAAHVKRNMAKPQMLMMAHGPVESIREDDYKGHHIVVRTTYQIEVDGKPVTGHVDVSNDGQVAYHGLPNMTFDSAVQMVKSLIDQFPDDFRPGSDQPQHDMSNMSGMGHEEHSMGHAAAPKAAAKAKNAPKPRKSK